MIVGWNRLIPPEKPSLRHLEYLVRNALLQTLDEDMIDPILEQAEQDNPAAQFMIGGALEAAGESTEGSRWYRRSASLGYRPAMERLRIFAVPAASPEHCLID